MYQLCYVLWIFHNLLYYKIAGNCKFRYIWTRLSCLPIFKQCYSPSWFIRWFLAVSKQEVNLTNLVDVLKGFVFVVYHCCKVGYVTQASNMWPMQILYWHWKVKIKKKKVENRKRVSTLFSASWHSAVICGSGWLWV
jgi:hypothetical protein